MTETDFIAEIDGDGAVAWVWRKGSRDRTARPIGDAERFLHELAQARCHGADRPAISEWFRRQARSRGSDRA